MRYNGSGKQNIERLAGTVPNVDPKAVSQATDLLLQGMIDNDTQFLETNQALFDKGEIDETTYHFIKNNWQEVRGQLRADEEEFNGTVQAIASILNPLLEPDYATPREARIGKQFQDVGDMISAIGLVGSGPALASLIKEMGPALLKLKDVDIMKLVRGKVIRLVPPKGSTGKVVGNNASKDNVVHVNTTNSTIKGTSDYDALNNSAPNTHYELDNGTTFKTNSGGRVEEVTFTPVDQKVPRDNRQTAVGHEGQTNDVGGHVQACSMGGTCDRFNLFPQDKNFNNSGYKKFENEIRDALKNGDDVGAVTVKFKRSDPNAARPDALRVEYMINGKRFRKEFKNQYGG